MRSLHLNVIITSDSLIYAKILEHFDFMLDQLQYAKTFDLV